MDATAAKKVIQPASPSAPHFSLEMSYIPASSPSIKSFMRLDGWDLAMNDRSGLSLLLEDEEDGSVIWSDVHVVDDTDPYTDPYL